MPSFENFSNFATACWKRITCSDSLPSPSQEEIQDAIDLEQLRIRIRRQKKELEEQQIRRIQLQQRLDHNFASSSKTYYDDSSDSSDNGGGISGGNNDNDGGNSGGNNDNDGGNDGDNGGGNDGDNGSGNNDGDNGENDKNLWSLDLERHSCGELSYAVTQAKSETRNYSQVEVGSNAILVGIYDGHVGPHASWYIRRNLMTNLIARIRQHGTLTEDALEKAILATDEGFLKLAKRAQGLEPEMVINGSSCLVGIIWKGILFIAHVGVSRAINGVVQEPNNRILALPLTLAHDVNESWVIRQQLKRVHTRDRDFLVQGDDGTWRIKGLTQLSRSIGDAYLKRNDVRVDPSFKEHQLPRGHLSEPALSAEPDVTSRPIKDTDRFFIFASSRFWEHMTNNRAVNIVHANPREGIAKRLLKTVTVEAARKAHVSYSDLLETSAEERRAIHGDMAVVVVFVDHNLAGDKDSTLEQRSFKGFKGGSTPSEFRTIDELM